MWNWLPLKDSLPETPSYWWSSRDKIQYFELSKRFVQKQYIVLCLKDCPNLFYRNRFLVSVKICFFDFHCVKYTVMARYIRRDLRFRWQILFFLVNSYTKCILYRVILSIDISKYPVFTLRNIHSSFLSSPNKHSCNPPLFILTNNPFSSGTFPRRIHSGTIRRVFSCVVDWCSVLCRLKSIGSTWFFRIF